MRLPARTKSIFPALCLIAAMLILFALAPRSGGSFSVAAKPQNTTFSAAAEGDISPAAGVSLLPFASALLPISAYRIEPETDFAAYCEAGAEVMRTLALYPDGFFETLSGYVGGIVIELCGGIRSGGSMPDRPAAVTADCLSFRLIALETDPQTIGPALMHELCHVIDCCLDSASIGDPSRWNDEAWGALNPKDFRYYSTYDPAVYESGETKYAAEAPFDPEDVYFINRYAMTYPTEDRAVAFETMMRLSPGAECMKSPHIRAKLAYYFAAIRYYLDPGGTWSTPSFWEKAFSGSGQSGI